MTKTIALVMASVILACYAHPQWRKLVCTTPTETVRGGNETAECHLVIKDTEDEEPGRPALNGEGCFKEIHKGEERVYCDLICPKSHTVFHSAFNLFHRACFNYYTYQLEKRDNDWLLWRSGKCLNSTATFTIGCKFDEPFSTQFANDEEVFDKLRTRRLF